MVLLYLLHIQNIMTTLPCQMLEGQLCPQPPSPHTAARAAPIRTLLNPISLRRGLWGLPASRFLKAGDTMAPGCHTGVWLPQLWA